MRIVDDFKKWNKGISPYSNTYWQFKGIDGHNNYVYFDVNTHHMIQIKYTIVTLYRKFK